MVQLVEVRSASYKALGEPVNDPAEYWKVRTTSFHTRAVLRRYLAAKNYNFAQSAIFKELKEHYVSHQMGLPWYYQYSVEKLRKFVKDRKIVQEPKKAATKEFLVQVLKMADQEATFVRFLDLPPELRVRIYKMHFDSILTDDLTEPHLPPITATSRLLRRESLNIFYAQAITRLNIGWPVVDDNTQESDWTYFTSKGTAANLSLVHRLYIQVEGIAKADVCYGNAFVLITLDKKGENESKIEFVKGRPTLTLASAGWPTRKMPEKLNTRLERLLRAGLGVVDDRPGKRQFVQGDLRRFFVACASVLKQWNDENL